MSSVGSSSDFAQRKVGKLHAIACWSVPDERVREAAGVRQVSPDCPNLADAPLVERPATLVSPDSLYQNNPRSRSVLRPAVDSCWTTASCCSPRCSRAWTRCPIGNASVWTTRTRAAWTRRRSRRWAPVNWPARSRSVGPSVSTASPRWTWALVSLWLRRRSASTLSVSSWWVSTTRWSSAVCCFPCTSRPSISTWTQASGMAEARRTTRTVWCWRCCRSSSGSCESRRTACYAGTRCCAGNWCGEGTPSNRASCRPNSRARRWSAPSGTADLIGAARNPYRAPCWQRLLKQTVISYPFYNGIYIIMFLYIHNITYLSFGISVNLFVKLPSAVVRFDKVKPRNWILQEDVEMKIYMLKFAAWVIDEKRHALSNSCL